MKKKNSLFIRKYNQKKYKIVEFEKCTKKIFVIHSNPGTAPPQPRPPLSKQSSFLQFKAASSKCVQCINM